MKISVIIPVFNAQVSIYSCLQCLLKQERMPDEILLVENGSTDRSVEIIEEFINKNNDIPIRLLREEKKGPGNARNKGIREAKGDIIAFTDSDCMAEHRWIKNIEKAFNDHPGLDAVGGVDEPLFPAVSVIEKLLSVVWLPKIEKMSYPLSDKKEKLFESYFISTFNCAYRKNIVDKINGFDGSFQKAGEDIDIYLRAIDEKAKILPWHPEIVICHQQRISFWAMIKKAFNYGESLAHIVKRHFNGYIYWAGILPFKKRKSFKLTIILLYTGNKLMMLISVLFVFLMLSKLLCQLTFLAFCAFLYWHLRKRIYLRGHQISPYENFLALLCYICREVAEESGRVWGSAKYKCICL